MKYLLLLLGTLILSLAVVAQSNLELGQINLAISPQRSALMQEYLLSEVPEPTLDASVLQDRPPVTFASTYQEDSFAALPTH